MDTPVQQPPAPVQNNLKIKINELKTKVQDRVTPFYNNLPHATQKMVVVGGILMSIVLLLLILALLFAPKRNKQVVEATPTPVGTSVPFPTAPAITSPSRYATDSGVLKIENDVKGIEGQLNQIDVKESNLNLPDLDWNVKFNQ